jgi:oxygen-independent coproporphyrinogen-3 oxidase
VFSIDFDEYFAQSIADLSSFKLDEIISINKTHIRITNRGLLLVRNICMSFDQYQTKPAHNMRYSRVI